LRHGRWRWAPLFRCSAMRQRTPTRFGCISPDGVHLALRCPLEAAMFPISQLYHGLFDQSRERCDGQGATSAQRMVHPDVDGVFCNVPQNSAAKRRRRTGSQIDERVEVTSVAFRLLQPGELLPGDRHLASAWS
jgi:hypothetical protein